MKSYENEFKIILQYKYHHWIFRKILYEYWQIVDYELRFNIARKGRKLRLSVLRIFTAYRGISRVRHTRFEQRWNEDESSSVHRETVAFTMRVKLGRQQQSHVNASEDKVQLQKRKGSVERTEFGLRFLDDIRGEDIIRDSHLQECLLRQHDGRHSEKHEQSIVIIYFQYRERRSGTKSQINWKENSRGRITFTAEASNLLIGRNSCNPKTISGLFHQEWWITQRFLTRV